MIDSYRLADFLRDYLKNNDMSEEELAERSGLSVSTIRTCVLGHNPYTDVSSNPAGDTIIKLAKGMDINYVELRGMVLERPEAYYLPVRSALSDSPERDSIFYKKEIIPVAWEFCKDDALDAALVKETLVYKVSETNLYPFIMDGDYVVVWLNEEIRDGDLLAVSPEEEEEDQPCFYKVKMINKTEMILYGNADSEPIMFNVDDEELSERVIGKVVSIQRHFTHE